MAFLEYMSCQTSCRSCLSWILVEETLIVSSKKDTKLVSEVEMVFVGVRMRMCNSLLWRSSTSMMERSRAVAGSWGRDEQGRSDCLTNS